MLENIYSSYITKIIFFHLKEKVKLDLIKYNKTLQKKIDINIINYKIITGTYIHHEPSGLTQEYNGYNDILIFEGEYLNGKRNGKGKEYNLDGKVIFEG